jgi:hypothetical protein
MAAGMSLEQAPAWVRARYRVGQFLYGWRASVSAPDLALVDAVLGQITPEAIALFRRMPTDAQAHSLRVLRALLADDQCPHPLPPELTAAALLHDVGKVAAGDAGAYLGLWLRGPLVLLEKFTPGLLARWAAPQPSGSMRYAMYVHGAHPQIGAAWAQTAGCPPLTCWLIAHHQDLIDQLPGDQLPGGALLGDASTAKHYLARLQRADGRN